MSSKRRIESSRANGAQSHGPVSPAGRMNSSANSARHQLLSETVVLENERLGAFHDLLAALTREFNPQTETQTSLVETMAIARWRLMRVWAVERATLNVAIDKFDPNKHDPSDRAALAFRALADESRTLDLIHRYEVRYDRQYARALNILMKLADPKSPLTQFCQTNPIPQTDSDAGLTEIDLPLCGTPATHPGPCAEGASLPPGEPAATRSPAHADPSPDTQLRPANPIPKSDPASAQPPLVTPAVLPPVLPPTTAETANNRGIPFDPRLY